MVPQQCTPRIRTSTYAVPNTVVIDTYVRELYTYTLTFRADAQVGGQGDLPHRDVYGCYYVLMDAVVSHIEVHTATTTCRTPPSDRCRSNGYAGACDARCNYTSAEAY